MPTQKIIITLHNDANEPDNVQMHVDVEDKGTAKDEAEAILNDSAVQMCELFIQTIEQHGGESIADQEVVGHA